MKVTQLRIGLHEFNDSIFKKCVNSICRDYFPNIFIKDENNYFSEAIELDGQYFYKVDGVVISITKYEYECVISNPYLYYFSTALKLHNEIRRARSSI